MKGFCRARRGNLKIPSYALGLWICTRCSNLSRLRALTVVERLLAEVADSRLNGHLALVGPRVTHGKITILDPITSSNVAGEVTASQAKVYVEKCRWGVKQVRAARARWDGGDQPGAENLLWRASWGRWPHP